MNIPLSEDLEIIIQNLNEDQLRMLNHVVVKRLKIIQQEKRLRSLAKFNLYDRVYFDHEGERILGRVIRINQKTCTIKTDDRGEWRIPLKRSPTPKSNPWNNCLLRA